MPRPNAGPIGNFRGIKPLLHHSGGIDMRPKDVVRPAVTMEDVSSSPAGAGPHQARGQKPTAASLPARLIPAAAEAVLDLCAAPGGKTMQLAAAGHDVTSVDASESRLARLRENLDRTHLEARLVRADALDWEPDEPFDAILLDAPCSATGTFRRHPEVLYRARPSVIAERKLTRIITQIVP